MKKAIPLLLAFVLLRSLAVPAFAAGGFTGVADNAWYANAVSYVQSHGLMSGTGNSLLHVSSSGLGESGQLLAEMAGTGDWQEGQRFQSSASEEEVAEWVNSLG